MSPRTVITAYNVLMLILVSGMLFSLWRLNPGPNPALFFLAGAVLVVVSVAGALSSPIAGFGQIRLLAWAAFAHYPLFLLGGAYLLSGQNRALALVCAGLAAVILAIFVDAFLVEPRWLQVTRVTIPSTRLPTAVRVAVIADLQTDAPGRYEGRALRRVRVEEPDLILLAGDYLHLGDHDRYVAMGERLNEMLREVDLEAPLGVYAVRGNVDWPGTWQEIFAGLPVTTFESSRTLDLGPLALTGLALQDSVNPRLSVEAPDKFHVVLGHTPNFSLGQVEADVLVAGHTHGGQVQIPFVGPLMTLSQVPRSWASGVTEIEPGKLLVVSRGIGMERGLAPRMRFLCRPQLVILDLVPIKASSNQ